MGTMSRRSVLAGGVGLAAAGGLSRPCIVNAEPTTATVWQVQGFVPRRTRPSARQSQTTRKPVATRSTLASCPLWR